MGGIDGYDWSVFGGNPAPGDPDAVRAIAARLRDLADGVGVQSRLLQSVGSDSESIWVGPAASAFRPHLDKLPDQLGKLTTSYGQAADALDAYWPALADAQQMAVEAWHKARAAQYRIDAAQAQVHQAGQDTSSAADAYNGAVTASAGAPPDPTGATATKLATLQATYQQAASRLSAANSQLTAADASMQAAHALAAHARARATTAAGRSASALRSAGNAGIHNPHQSWFSSVVDGVEGVIGGAVNWVEHHAGTIEFVASLALGPVGLMLTPEGRHLAGEALHGVEEGLKEAAPALEVVSAGLGIASAVLAVAGLVLAPVGLGEVIDVVNEGVTLAKTADDGLLLAAGERSAEASLAEDGVALATGGLGRLFGDAGDAASASGEVEKVQAEAEQALSGARQAERALSSTRAAAEETIAEASAHQDLYAAMAADARAEGNPYIANQLEGRAAAEADSIGAAGAPVALAERNLETANSTLEEAQSQVTDREAAFSYHEKYDPLSSPSSARDSFVGRNNLAKFREWKANQGAYQRAFYQREGIPADESFGNRFVQYYKGNLFNAPTRLNLAGSVLHGGQQVINLYWGYKGVGELPGNVSTVIGAG